ncbi:hypothetical protein OG765_35350 [Streptomyces sp. NBC_00555]|uniref:hypothetical protein n=1 Tax=Streptomyces sp. NBC_00555 TaxID=2903662 RepID=UPI0022530AE2|nr:hypothetical protein [Streptomyces sp. NBC_00555]MCX5016206.1 hypothetical protein [Streptomyces sp. NBC_00555]
METRHPGSLAEVALPVKAGWRLLFVPSRARELAVALGGSIMVPPLVASPLLLAALVAAVIWGNSFFWGSFWVLLALTVVAVIVLAVAMVFVTVSLTVRWVEFRPLGTPAQVVIARFLRSSTMAMADLQRVVVIERLSLGQRQSIKVVLHTGSGTVECEPATSAPLSRVDAQALTGWLTEQLGQVQVAVERQTEVKRDFLRPDEWWPRSHTAELWRVPVGEVDGIAAQRGVEIYRYTPRAAAMYSPGTTVTVYDPGRAYDVAEELRAERAAGQAADSTAGPGPAEDDATDPR